VIAHPRRVSSNRRQFLVANFALHLQSDIFMKCFHRQTYFFFWLTSFTVLLLLYINYKLLNTVGLLSSIAWHNDK